MTNAARATDLLGGIGVTDSQLLGALTIAGFVIAALSSIWGLVTKTTYEDGNKAKRLTAAGQVAIAITLASAMLSTVSFGFKTYADENARKRDRDAAADKLAKDRAERAEQNARYQAGQLKLLKAQSDQQKKTLEILSGQYKLLASSEQQRRMQIIFANRASKEAGRTLFSANAALAQLQRLLNPANLTSVEIVFALDDSTPEGRTYIERLAAAGTRFQNDPDAAAREGAFFTRVRPETGGSFSFSQSSQLAPDSVREPEVYKVLSYPWASVALILQDRVSASGLSHMLAVPLASRPGQLSFVGDLGFAAYARDSLTPQYWYDIDRRTVRLTIRDRPKLEDLSASGNIFGIQDLERARAFVALSAGSGDPSDRTLAVRDSARLEHFGIEASGRHYSLYLYIDRDLAAGFPIFRTPPMKAGLVGATR